MKTTFLLFVYCFCFRSYKFQVPNVPKCVNSDVTTFQTTFKPICGKIGDKLVKSVLDCLSASGIFSKDSLGECAIKSTQDFLKQLCDGDVKFKDNYCCLLNEDLKINPDIGDPIKRATIFKECLESPEDSCEQQVKDLKKEIQTKCSVFPKNEEYPLQLYQCFRNNGLLVHERNTHSGIYQPYKLFDGICTNSQYASTIYCRSINLDYKSSSHKTIEAKGVVKKCMAEKNLPKADVCQILYHDLAKAADPKCPQLERDGQYVVSLMKCFNDKGLLAHRKECQKYNTTPHLFFGSICPRVNEIYELYCCSAKRDFASEKETIEKSKKIVDDCFKETVDPCLEEIKLMEDGIAKSCKDLSKDGKYPENLFKCFTDDGLMAHQNVCQRAKTKPHEFFQAVCEKRPFATDQLCCSAPKDFPSLSSPEQTAKIKQVVNKCMETVKK